MGINDVPEWWDIEVATLSDMLAKGMWMPHEVPHIRRQLQERKDILIEGLGNPTQMMWTIRVQAEVDPLCRVRRDRHHGWMLDRFVENVNCWHPVGYIGAGGRAARIIRPHGEQEIVVIDDHVRPDLIDFLKSRDMQRPGYIKEKRDAAERIRKANEDAATEKVAAAVDGLSTKRLDNFIAVERAIQTGETITMRGDDQRRYEIMKQSQLKYAKEHGKLPDIPQGQSMNPGMHPRLHKRKVGGKHITEK